MLEFTISATSKSGGKAMAKAHHSEISIDASAGRDEVLPNPAELLLTSVAACILKNLERYSEKLHIPYEQASIVVSGSRHVTPPVFEEITYKVEITTSANERQVNLLHRNVIKFGTISNTMAKAVKLDGTFTKLNK